MRLLFSISLFLFIFSMAATGSAIDKRMRQEKRFQELGFSITPYKPNYLLPFTYNKKIQSYDAYQDIFLDDELQPVEVKFQISFKVPLLVVDIPELPISVFFGYTQVSFWQAYNSDNSSPFRETNYEPELFAAWEQNIKLIGDWNFKLATLNLTHQSNGKAGSISRSWNRIEGSIVFANNNFALAINPWHRFKESANADDNPDLLDYYGHGKINALYRVADNTFSLTSRNNIESDFSKGSVEFGWSFPLHNRVRGYLQLFSGYGNSLVEYNEYTNAVGLGISLTDWL